MARVKALMTQFFEALWYKPNPPFWAIILFKPLELLYCYLSTRKRTNTTPIKHPVPIIVVGNITVGGTGKTPLLIYLTQLLKEQGYKPAVISRGYAAKEKLKEPLLLSTSTSPQQAGDEPVLIYQRTQVPVCVFPKRNSAIQKILNTYPECNVILSDDGLQHYAMGRDIEIVVIDGKRLFGNEQCLPLGPLREKLERLETVDFKIINGASWSGILSSTNAFRMQTKGNVLYALHDSTITKPLIDFANQNVNVITGIGNPKRFISTLKQAGLNPQLKCFSDHYSFQSSDLVVDNSNPIIMTEKDAVKCRELKSTNTNLWYLPITVEVKSGFDELLLQRLQEVSTPCKNNY